MEKYVDEPIGSHQSEIDTCDWFRGSDDESCREKVGHPRNWPAFFLLKGDKATILDRMMKRSGHFMPAQLIDSQFEALEHVFEEEMERLRPSTYDSFDISRPIEAIVDGIIAK